MLELERLQNVGSMLNGDEGVDAATYDSSANRDDALCYETYLMFQHLHSIILNSSFYPKGEEQSKLLQYVSENGQIPLALQNLPDSVVAVLKATRLSRLRPSVIELKGNGIPLNQPTQ